MNDLIEMIRAATLDGATPEQKTAAATACRNLAAALDAQPGQTIGASIPTGGSPSTVAMLAQLDVDQVLDLVIAKLRAKLGPDAAAASTPRGYRPPPLNLPGGSR